MTDELLFNFTISSLDEEDITYHLRKEFKDGILDHIQIGYDPKNKLVRFHVIDDIHSTQVEQRYYITISLYDLLRRLHVSSSTLIDMAEEMNIDDLDEGSYFSK